MYLQRRKNNESWTESDKKNTLLCIERSRNERANWQLYIATEMANGKFKIYVNMKENASPGLILFIVNVPRIERNWPQ